MITQLCVSLYRHYTICGQMTLRESYAGCSDDDKHTFNGVTVHSAIPSVEHVIKRIVLLLQALFCTKSARELPQLA